MTWDDLSPEHKAIAADGLAQLFGQADWQREMRTNPEGMMLAALHILRGPTDLAIDGWRDVLHDELTIVATWGQGSERKKRAFGFGMSYLRSHQEAQNMLRMAADCLSRDIAHQSGKPTLIHCLSFREAYDVLERKRRAG